MEAQGVRKIPLSSKAMQDHLQNCQKVLTISSLEKKEIGERDPKKLKVKMLEVCNKQGRGYKKTLTGNSF